jgi:hypothetical protein
VPDADDYAGGEVPPGATECQSGTILPFNSVSSESTYESNADVALGSVPETFRTTVARQSSGDGWPGLSGAGQQVTPDVWHHLLLSFDLTTAITTRGNYVVLHTAGDPGPYPSPETVGARTTGACKMWIALDDENLTQKKLSSYWPSGSADGNAIITVNGFSVATEHDVYSDPGAVDDCEGNLMHAYDVPLGTPQYDFTPQPFAISPLGLPAHGDYWSQVKHCEMGELQIFTGVSVDTASLDVRRAFITDKGKPAAMSKAADLFGKGPEVKLHGSSNWKVGRNTGTTAPDPPQAEVHVGKIKTFKPNPELGV